jgi:diaminopimelate decarboxylase
MKIPVSKLRDKDMQRAPKALAQAAADAKKLAEQTGTPFVVMRNGKLVQEILKPKTKRLT